MIRLTTTGKKIPATQLQDGDWVIGNVGDQQVLMRYQDSLQEGDFFPVMMSPELLRSLGFEMRAKQPKAGEAEVYALNDFNIRVVNSGEFIFEDDMQVRKDVHYLHLLQQVWREFNEEEFPDDIFEQPHTIEHV